MAVDNYNNAIKILPYRIKNILTILDPVIKNSTYEIRLRKNRPVMLYGNYGAIFIKQDSSYSKLSYHGAVYAEQKDIDEVICNACDFSLYSRQQNIREGYLTYGNGHRIGLSGESIMNNEKISMLKNIDSLCIRIATNEIALPEEIGEILFKPFKGIIVCGKPCSGKTTLLRAIAQKISSAYIYGYQKVVVIDERNELSLSENINCDVLRGYTKHDGIIHAVRTLSPDIIICDEISSTQEADKISDGFNTGVRFIVSVHVPDIDELFSRKISSQLIKSGCFDRFIILDDGMNAGKIKKIISTENQIL